MLVLSRRTGEKILVGDSVVITVLEIGRGKVRVGIEAPRETRVVRGELLGIGREPRASTPSEPLPSPA